MIHDLDLADLPAFCRWWRHSDLCRSGRMPVEALRRRWKRGIYRGVPPELAKAMMG